MEQSPRPSRPANRRTIEKIRRKQMKDLYSRLDSLVPRDHSSREAKALTDQLDEAANYIKKLQTKLEKMKAKRESLLGVENRTAMSGREANVDPRAPQIDIYEMGSALKVNLVTGLDCEFMFNETIRMLHEEGLEIVNASFSVTNNTVFHTIHSKVGDYAPGGGTARISERLKNFVAGANY